MRKFGISEFTGSQPILVGAKVAKDYLNEKELREMGQSIKTCTLSSVEQDYLLYVKDLQNKGKALQ